MLKPIVSLIVFLIAGITSAAAQNPEVRVSSPENTQTPAYRCRVRQLDDQRHIFAVRELDRHGQFLSESIQWSKAGGRKSDTTPYLVISWHPEYGHQSFEKGMVGLFFHDRPRLTDPLRLSLSASEDNTATRIFDAGAGMPVSPSKASNSAEAYIQAGTLLDIAPTSPILHWQLERLDRYRGKPVELYTQGNLDLAFLKAAKAEFPALMQRLDALQAQYLRDCERV